MAAMQDLVGSAKLANIQRQRGRSADEGEWMREASMNLATGKPAAVAMAFEAYDSHGRISWAANSDGAVDRAVSSYM
ncbi:hypothetical protein AB4084_37755, partial [Lysobacter sp. 2RAB21]